MRKVWLVFMAAAALCVLAGCKSPRQRAFEAAVLGKTAPDFELDALDGGKVRLSGFRGKPILLTFFAYG